ncbi:MAG TPA: DUF6531 domain-containing protein [Mycobacteriales bacterium]|nr:DUF6531 domain-containing protein [Mycobacteriales bacterium]
MARGGRAAGRAAEGIIAKAVRDLFRLAGRDVARDAARSGARDAARDTARTAARDTARTAARDAERDTARDAARSLPGRSTRGDPVDVATGEVVLRQVDVDLPGLLPLLLARTHLSSYRDGRWFGPSWASTLDQRIEVSAGGVRYYAADGARLFYPRGGTTLAGLPIEGARLPLATVDGGYAVQLPELGQTLHFGTADDPFATVLPLAAVTDRNGHRIELGYEGGVLVEVRHSAGHRVGVHTVGGLVTELRLLGAAAAGVDAGAGAAADVTLARFGYDTEQRLTEVINASGLPLRFDYDVAGRLTGWADRNGTSYRYRYDGAGRCVGTAGTGGCLSTSFEYGDGSTRVTDSLGHTSTFRLNQLGQVVGETDPLGHTATTEWDRYDRVLSRTDHSGRTTRYGYDEAGNLVAVTRPDGRQTTASYTELRLPATITGPDGAIWRWAYDQRGNLVSGTDPAGATTRYGYDDRSHLATVTDPLGRTSRIGSDPAGLPVAVTDPLGATTRYDRDGFGRVAASTDPLGNITRYGWTVGGRLASRTLPDGATERWSYDPEGNLVTYTDPLGQLSRTEVGTFDLPVAQTGPTGARLEFGYDTELRLVTVTDPHGLTWRYEYDPAGNLARETDFNGRVLTYRHDPAGRLVERTNGAGETVTLVRNQVGEVVERRAGDTVTTFEYDPAGRVLRAAGPDAEVDFEWDALGRVRVERCNGRAVESGYDAAGDRLRRRTPSGVDSRWEYDANRRPVELHSAGQVLRFGYDLAGREVARRLGSAALLVQTWDHNGRLRSQTLDGTAGPPRQHRGYGYRADGYLTGRTDQLDGPRRYDLDPIGQVTAVHGPQWTERYRYDLAGNITAAGWPAVDPASADGQGEREYAGTLLRRAGAVHYEHDGQGRLTRRRHRTLSGQFRDWRYEWDAEDRLTAVTTPSGERWRYSYDPFGRRISKQISTADGTAAARVDFSWDGVLLAEQTDGTGRTTTWDWQPGTFRPLTQHSHGPPRPGTDEQFYAIVTDLVGTPTELVTAAGAVAWHRQATLWGISPRTPTDCPLRFPGQYHDPESGTDYNFRRHYDPGTASYCSDDPLGLGGGTNPSRYVKNPARTIDPLGLTPYDPSGRPHLDEVGGPGETVPLYKAPQRNLGQSQYDHGYRAADFPGQPGEVPDGLAYFARDRSIADGFAASYGEGVMEVRVPVADYARDFARYERPYEGGPRIEVPIPADVVERLNPFPRIWHR